MGEALAADHFTRLGFAIVARNVRTRRGEIDLIVCDGHTLAFVEVKSRQAEARAIPQVDSEQAPLYGLRRVQQQRLRRLAGAWLSEQSPRERPAVGEIRFDAVGVTVDKHDRLLRLDHLEAAW